VLVIYAILAEQNIAKMFAAALVPGILAALGYMLLIGIVVRVAPGSVGRIEPRCLGRSACARCAPCSRWSRSSSS
jgi:TRAP-type C4-dicarboxylate transport system permease large subunit